MIFAIEYYSSVIITHFIIIDVIRSVVDLIESLSQQSNRLMVYFAARALYHFHITPIVQSSAQNTQGELAPRDRVVGFQ